MNGVELATFAEELNGGRLIGETLLFSTSISHVRAALYAAIHHHIYPVTYAVYHLGQSIECCACAIRLPPTLIG